MDIDSTLFQSLLRQQNITEFRVFTLSPSCIGNSKLDNNIKIGYRYVDLSSIYAYIKDDIFHICDRDFNEIKLSDIYFSEKGLHRIGFSREEYFYPYNNNDNSIVIDSGGHIILKNPKDYFFIGTKEFLEDSPVFINDFGEGLLFDCRNNEYITPFSYDFWNGYEHNYNALKPTTESKTLYIDGAKDENLNYLFSIKKHRIDTPLTISYFTNPEDKSIVYFESSKYGSAKKEIKPVCLWYSGGNVYAVTIKLLNELDADGRIIIPDDPYTPPISFEVIVNSGATFDCCSRAVLEFNGSLENKYSLQYLFNNLEFISTKSALLILFSDNYRDSHHAIIINDKGKITLCRHLKCSSVALTENNILRLSYRESDAVDYCDIYGTLLCTAERYAPEFQIFTRNLREPSAFNPQEVQAQLAHQDRRFFEEGVYSQLEGVINLQTGTVVIPPCYSKIQLRKVDDSAPKTPQYVAIVRIDNFFNGVRRSYYGIYLNEKLTTPIAYSDIHFLKYKTPRQKIIRAKEVDQCFIEHESCFMLLERNGLYGVASMNGTPIIEPCADSFKLLVETTCTPIKNEKDMVFINHVPANAPEYITLCRDGVYNLIYRDKIISDFVIDDFELFSIENEYDNELFFIKVISDSKEAIVYNGRFITDYFHNVEVFQSKFGSADDKSLDDYVIVLTDENGKSALFSNRAETIIEFGNYKIVPYLNYVIKDSLIIDKHNRIIFDAKDYILIDEKKGYNNQPILCYHNECTPSEYIVIDSEGKLHKINADDDSSQPVFYLGLKRYYFDRSLLRFEKAPEIEEDYDDHSYADYPDDNDYERDTYYALGGYDYDEWKNTGGNLDDMMDEMGF